MGLAEQNKTPLKFLKGYTEELEASKVNQINMSFYLPPGYKAYFDEFQIKSPKEELVFGTLNGDPVFDFKDPFSGEFKLAVEDGFSLSAKIKTPLTQGDFFVELRYQACTESFCLLPQWETIKITNSLGAPAGKSLRSLLSFENPIDFNQSSYFLVFFLVFLAGILTSFTPCIFPLIPITLSVIGVRNKSVKAGFLKSLLFVSGIAVTYSALGVLAASTGSFLGELLAHPAVLVCVVLIYLLMALSLLGLFNFDFFQRLGSKAPQFKGPLAPFLFGMMTGVFASPCVSPVLVSILTFVGQTQSLVYGALLLATYAFGFGMIFLVAGSFSGALKKLPQSGAWLNGVKYFLAALLLLGAYYFARPLIKLYSEPQAEKILLSTQLKEAVGQNVLIDFYADWCFTCEKLDRLVLNDPEVKARLASWKVIKVDFTSMNEEKKQLAKTYKILGLPYVLFYNKKGERVKSATLTEYENKQKFLKRLDKVEGL